VNKKQENNRVVVTGIGVVSAIGNEMNLFESALFQGKIGTRYIQELEEYGFYCLVAGVPDISAHPKTEFLKRYNLQKSSSLLQYAILAGLDAWENAMLSIPDNYEQSVLFNDGCIIGSGFGPLDLVAEKLIPYSNKGKKRKLRSTIVEQSMLYSPSAHLSMILGLGNQVSFNSSACATGTEAIILAAERIRTGQAKRMLAGGTEGYSPYTWMGFDVLRVLNRSMNDTPEKASCPMNENAAGFIPGAGAGILLLESLTSALERNAPIHAEISGTHINSGGMRNEGTMTAPSSEAVIKCIKESIQDAGISVSDIDYINGHLSSTMADVLEIRNITKALNRFGSTFPFINSLKAQTGHCIGAGGAIETIAAILQIQSQKIAASVNSKPLHPEIAKLIDNGSVPDKIINYPIKHVLKTSFGFGDVNACIIISKY
jgi:3-oxoacyl-[acyl-carrier-protein] synthase I